jgi:hypothetical protein
MPNHGKPPSPVPGLETKIIALLQQLFKQLPTGAAELLLSRVPGHPEWPNPYFEVRPRNARAARFSGVIIETDLDLTIGKFATREFPGFARGGTLVKGLTAEEEFQSIWRTVTAGGFAEQVYYDRHGKVAKTTATILVENIALTFGYGGGFMSNLIKRKKETVLYEPY